MICPFCNQGDFEEVELAGHIEENCREFADALEAYYYNSEFILVSNK